MNDLMKFTHTYQMSKTLRFELKPVGKTLENIKKNGIISEDEKLSESYKQMKKTIDEYHKWFIGQALSGVQLTGLDDYEKLYNAPAAEKAQDKFEDKIEAARITLRKQIANSFKADGIKDKFDVLDKKELVKNDLKQFALANDLWFDDKFEKFTTYFTGFNTNRQNMYSADKKSTAIAYRIVDENLPKFIDNIATFKKAAKTDVSKNFSKLEDDLGAYIASVGFNNPNEMFTLDGFNKVLTQQQIEAYNAILGGKKEDKVKLQGLNEYINLYNQQQTVKGEKLPKFKMLYKQILSDREAVSFLTEPFETKTDMLDAVNNFYKCQITEYTIDNKTENVIKSIENLLSAIEEYDGSKIYIRNDSGIKTISKAIFSNPMFITEALRSYYDAVADADYQNKLKKAKSESQLEKAKSKFVSETKYFSFALLQAAIKLYVDKLDSCDVCYKDSLLSDYFKHQCSVTLESGKKYTLSSLAEARYSAISGLLNGTQTEQLTQIEKDNLKLFMDTLLDIAHLIKPLYVSADAALDCDELFYTKFAPLYEQMDMCSNLYDKVRNFATKKPYSTDKFKLNFSCGTFMNGWALANEKSYHAIMLRKGCKYFIAVIDGNSNCTNTAKILNEESEKPGYQKMDYMQLSKVAGDLKHAFFSGLGKRTYNPDKEILRIVEIIPTFNFYYCR